MTKTNLFELSDAEYEAWLASTGICAFEQTMASDENLIKLFGAAMRMTDVQEKAQALVDVATMCMALAEKTLGFPATTAKLNSPASH